MLSNQKTYIFRNHTAEPFFKNYTDTEIIFSGYDSISDEIPTDTQYVLWFYVFPVKMSNAECSELLSDYLTRLSLIVQQLDKTMKLVTFTIGKVYNHKTESADFSLEKIINQYNTHLFDLATEHNNVHVFPFHDWLECYPIEKRFEPRFYYISKIAINPALVTSFNTWFNRQSDALLAIRKKAIILDLDNTLWGGVLGEDGLKGIKLGNEYPGNTFVDFQKLLKLYSQSGILLAICSKNNEDDVWQAIQNHPDMVLKKEDFSAWQINWSDKASNIRMLAQELNIGLDSIVFIDDNPRERELIKQNIPEVEAPDFPVQPYILPQFIHHVYSQYFLINRLTNEDIIKTQQYKAFSKRQKTSKTFSDLKGYIKSLEIKIQINSANDFNIPRMAQMTQKTNQFNLTTKRYSEQDILSLLHNKNAGIFCANISDRFGDDGITALCILIPTSIESIHIDTYLLSCRILGKEIEYIFLKEVMNFMHKKNIKMCTANYSPTNKNQQVIGFYEKMGFRLVKNSEQGKHYQTVLEYRQINKENIYHLENQII